MLLKKYSDFGGGKKKSDSEFLTYNLMLISGKKICALHEKKKILTLVLSENFMKKTPHSQWSVPNQIHIDELHAEDIFMIILLSAQMKLFVSPLVHSLKTYDSFLFIDKQRRIC